MTSQRVDSYLSPAACIGLAKGIEEAGGNEVFFLGRPGECGRIGSVEVFCRGNSQAVPALRQIGRPGEVVLHNHPSGFLSPSEPDLALASHYGQKAVGFFIINNDASDLYVVVEPFAPKEKRTAPDVLEALFSGPEGLPRILPGYEPRSGQIELAQAVALAQDEGEILLAEAGTGTGKSLAYLIPSALRALNNGERVAVATRTRHLQDQLDQKDSPKVERLLPQLKVAVLKGRTNYLCLRKLHARLAELDADSGAEEWESLNAFLAWAETTSSGERDDLGFAPPMGHWQLVQSQTEHTLRAKCPHFDDCFYYRSRREATRAQLLLVNHHLLLADRALRQAGSAGGLLPDYEHVVLDEGHHIEDAATDFAGDRVTGRGLLQALGRLRPLDRRKKGLATRLAEAHLGPDEESRRLRAAADEVHERTGRCRELVIAQVDGLVELLLPRLSGRGVGADGSFALASQRSRKGGSFRLEEDLEKSDPELFAQLSDRLDILGQALRHCCRGVEDLMAELLDQSSDVRERHRQLSFDLSSVQRRLESGVRVLSQALSAHEDWVRWIEITRSLDGSSEARICLAPVEVGEVIRQHLVETMRSVVFTSATLRVEESFDHFARRVGLDDAELGGRRVDLALPSPFSYSQQVFLGFPRDLPVPDRDGYIDAVSETVARAVAISQGRAFVLLTSYKSLHQIAAGVARRLGADFALLRQGDLPRSQLLERFVSARKGVLFGTDSFWEGVDVQGDKLSLVVVPRLPFRLPSEPVQKARCERIEARGGDPFQELSLPQAILRFRQGFGRLIRHRNDRGAVLVLDTRILSRAYGRRFRRSLPLDLKGRVDDSNAILEGMEEFFAIRSEEDHH